MLREPLQGFPSRDSCFQGLCILSITLGGVLWEGRLTLHELFCLRLALYLS